jgi:hypothetical protein
MTLNDWMHLAINIKKPSFTERRHTLPIAVVTLMKQASA